MRTISQPQHDDDQTHLLCLAPDLSAWAGKPTLVIAVLQTVQEVAEEKLRPVASMPDGTRLPSRMMLTLLTYCYAVGSYRSRNIEAGIHHDPVIRYLCGNYCPDSNLIRSFRFENRTVIEHCLERVCLVLWRLKFKRWPLNGHAQLAPRFSLFPYRIDPTFRMQIATEVRERLDRAEYLDKSLS